MGANPQLVPGTRGYDCGFGACAACGKDVGASCYWLGPSVVYRVGKQTIGNLFTPGVNRPLCGYKCGERYDKEARIRSVQG